MKRLCFILLALCFASCSTYIQVATLNSDTVQLNERGEFYYEDEVVRIEYSFNQAENGLFAFAIKNLSNEDIYVDMAKSYFINDGIAADYYGRSTTITMGGSRSSSYSKGTSYSNYPNKIESSGMVLTSSVSESISETKTAASYVGIPSESARIFTGFIVSDVRYTEEGLIEFPNRKDKEEREFNKDESPLTIVNRITIIIGGEEVVIENKMYASKYVNAVDNIKRSYLPYNEFMDNNQFYILYTKEYEYNYY